MVINHIDKDVKIKCLEEDLTQAQLADKIGTTAPYVSRIINKPDGVVNKPFLQMLEGLVMAVSRDKLGLDGEGMVDVLNVKCDPMLAGSLRQQDGFHPAYHLDYRLDEGICTMSACASTAAAVLIFST